MINTEQSQPTPCCYMITISSYHSRDCAARPTPRFYVHDRKTGPLSTFSAVNPRYSVVDSTTGLAVDELTSKRAANDTAKFLNTEATS